MGVVVNGFLTSVRKSSGGINFYKRKGVQVFRNKPQLPKDYVPSEAQRSVKYAFSLINDRAKATPEMNTLIKGGWGGNKRTQGVSNLNNFIGYHMRILTRAEGGAKLPFSEFITNLENLESSPVHWMQNVPDLTKSRYPIFFGEYFLPAEPGGFNVQAAQAVIENYRSELVKFSAQFENTVPPKVIIRYEDQPDTGENYFRIIDGVFDDGAYKAAIPDLDTGEVDVTFAFMFPKTTVDGTNTVLEYAITPQLRATKPEGIPVP